MGSCGHYNPRAPQMKILILTDGIAPFVMGGMQKHSFHLAQELALQGHAVSLAHCVAAGKNKPSAVEIEEAFGAEAMKNLRVSTFHFPEAAWYPGHYLKESYAYACQLYDYFHAQADSFDFIYAKGFCGWKWMQEKSNGKKIPPIGVKFHGYEMFQPPANWKMKLQNWLLQSPTRWNNTHADVIFSYGGDISRIIRDIAPGKTILEIPTGITADWIVPQVQPHAQRAWVFLGRFERRKGIEELHEAWLSLPEDSGIHLHMIGPIPHSKRIRSKNITYHGGLSNPNEIRAILDQCEAMIAPSHSEGMPNSIMEGMARGLAIMTTPVGAIPSIVDTTNGAFVEPGNAKALEASMRTWIDMSTEDMLKMRKASRSRVESFRWPVIATRTAEAISDYLSRHEST